MQEEIAEKKTAIAQEERELEKINEQYKSILKKADQMNIELRKYAQQSARLKRSVAEMQHIVEMEMPSLQAKFEELTSIEEEIVQLEERKKVTCDL